MTFVVRSCVDPNGGVQNGSLKSALLPYYPDQDMSLQPNILDSIVSRLIQLEPYKIVLFGSRAVGQTEPDSDIDLLVVLDSEAVSRTYQQKMEKRLSVRNRILEFSNAVAVDLVVYTKAEYRILEEANASFLKEIHNTGKTLYEKSGTGVA